MTHRSPSDSYLTVGAGDETVFWRIFEFNIKIKSNLSIVITATKPAAVELEAGIASLHRYGRGVYFTKEKYGYRQGAVGD